MKSSQTDVGCVLLQRMMQVRLSTFLDLGVSLVAELEAASDVRLAIDRAGSGLLPWTESLRMRASGASHVLGAPVMISDRSLLASRACTAYNNQVESSILTLRCQEVTPHREHTEPGVSNTRHGNPDFCVAHSSLITRLESGCSSP